jgi:hypothetical protein
MLELGCALAFSVGMVHMMVLWSFGDSSCSHILVCTFALLY